MTPQNKAAFITGQNIPIEIRPTPYTKPTEHELLIRTHAVAINPIDMAFQTMGTLFPWVNYPIIAGCDVAGEVIEVGASVTRFKPGDRVLGLVSGTSRQPETRPAEAGFQLYTIVKEVVAAPIPDRLSFIQASVIPLGLSTVASGMFQKDFLALRHPTWPLTPVTGEKEVLLIWGGSTSLGCNAIQLAVAAGYEVATTCSPRNYELVKKLGASQVFDYRSATITEDLVKAFEGRTTAGALAINAGSVEVCAEVMARTKGKKFVASAMILQPGQEQIGDVECKFIWGSSLENNEVGPAIYKDYLPHALEAGSFVPAPEAKVVGKGLEACQDALDIMKEGVSATKLVVDLSD